MTVSTDAYLFYGLCLKDESLPEWLFSKVNEKDYDEDGFQVIVDLFENVLEKTGCFLHYHCSADYPMLLLAAGEFTFADGSHAFAMAHRGYPIKITELPDTTGWDERINKVADAMGWPTEKRNIGWWLASYCD